MPSKQATKRNRSVVTASKGPSTGLIVGIVVIVLFAVAVGFGIYRAAKQEDGGAAIPPNATAAGISIGNSGAPASVDIYLDFQCPHCKAYETEVGPTLDSLIANGSAKVLYHPLAFLDGASDSKYSTRAASAAGCAAADKVFPQFLKLLYANQPPEGGHGLSNAQLIAYGQQAGAGANFAQCVNATTYQKWAAALTDQASKDGVNGTPTVEVNGTQIDPTVTALQQAVAAAHK